MGTEVKFPCVSCTQQVDIKDHAIQCELCKSWEHINCIREVDRPSEGLYAMLCEVQCNILWAVCSICRGKGSITQKVHELETRVILLDHQQQMSKLLLQEKEHLVEQLQRELLEVKSERDDLRRIIEKEQLKWTESKTASTAPKVELPKQASDPQPQLKERPQHVQFENLQNTDDHSSDSDSGATSFKYPPVFRELQKRIDKFSGKSDENDFEVWLVDFTEATTDCSWTDHERVKWFSWFLSGSAKVTWQRTVKTEDKTSWQKIVEIFRGQYGIHMDPRTAYQRCHDLQYNSFGSVQGLLEAMRDYQRMAPQKLSDANLESILWNKVPIKLQKEVGQLTEGSLQELFQKLLKAEEIVKERERRNSVSKSSASREFRPKSYYRTPAQNTSSVPSQQNPQREDNYKTRLQQESLKNVKCFKCGKKGHVAKCCHAIVNQICVEQPNKGQNTEGKHVDSTQIVPLIDGRIQNNQIVASDEETHAWICVLSVSECTVSVKSQMNEIGSVYKVNITIHGVPTRALIDSGSQVCIIRQQMLPIIKEKCNWDLSDLVSRNLPLNAQPVGAEGSALGATALVKLEVVIEATGIKLTVPCYVIDSTKPVWQGDVKNCGMIMGTNALSAFEFHISHSNGIEILPASSECLAKQHYKPDVSKSVDLSNQKDLQVNLVDAIKCLKPVQEDLVVQTPSLTRLVTLPKTNQLDALKMSMELVIGSKQEGNKTPVNQTSAVVLKHTVQIMPGITKWIEVLVQEQPRITDLGADFTSHSVTDTQEMSEQCTESSIPQYPYTKTDQMNLQQSFLQSSLDSDCVPIVVPDEKMILNEQCDFADGICNCQGLSKVSLMNWGTQPQVFRKGTVVGHIEQAKIVGHDDQIWRDNWEELPYSATGMVRMCHSENRLTQLQQQVKISDHCSEIERHQLVECLLEKSEVFALSDEELGETDVVEHSIDTSTAKPVKQPPRRLPYALRKQLEDELDKLLKINCIEPASSPYASPLVLVRKPDGNLRICVDYRNVNKDTILDRYPLPRVDELIDTIGSQKAMYFTTLDLMRGYHQVKMAEESKEKTAFVCHRGLYQYCRMPFGLTNAPATFQRLMDKLFTGWNFVFIYLDDILIASKSFSEHITHITQVLQRLQEAGLKVKPSKCVFGEKQVDYLGFNISARGVCPTHKNMLAVKEFPHPTTVKEVKRFLGLANFYRRHLQNMGVICRPLTALTRKDKHTGQPVTFEWSTKCEESFQRIKEMLSSSPVLIPPDLDKEFFLWCDACEDGFGVILEQIGKDGLRHPVAYASRATNEAERKYPPTKLEMAAIIFALEVYLLGHKITVYTDHQALVSGYISYLKGQSKGLLSRWYLKISQYLPHLMIEYKPGKSNEAADALSRAPAYTKEVSEHSDENGMVLQITVSTYPEEALLQNIQTQQSEDREIVDIINYLEKKILPTDSKEAKHIAVISKKGYFVLDGILYYESSEVPGRRRLVVPQQLRDKVVSENHDAIFSGHFSAKKMLQKLKQYFYWPGMSSMVFKKCESCLTCATTQGQERRQNPELHSIPVGEPFACIGMDFKEMDESCDKNRFALVFQDYLSKWPEVYAVADRTAPTVAKCLADLIYRHGVPSTIIHDRAPEFLSDVLQDTAFILGIKQLPTSPSHPQCDGLVERFNRTLKLMLAKLVENKGHDWDRLLGPVLFSYRTTPHSSTTETPFFLLYGRDAKLPSALDFYSPRPRTPVIYSEYGKTLFQELKQIRDMAKKSIQNAQKSQKKQYDKRSHPVTIKAGDTVFVKVQPKFKLDRNYHGPYRVYEATDTNVKVKPVSSPDAESRTISLQQVSKCKGNFSADQFWCGHNITNPRKQRKVRKKQNTRSRANGQPAREQPDVASQTTLPVYRTRYGRAVKPPK